jgi:Zn-dependent membrane protease YugP
LYAPQLAQAIAVVIAKRVKGKLDHRIPDDLPMTAGEWLAARLAALRMGVTAVVTDKHADAYRPLDKVIQLHDTTHFKADPVYWSTAAHELGHARIRAEYPAIGHLRTATRILSWPLFAVGIAGLSAYMLYAIELGGHIAFACFAVASALRAFVLIDEGFASVLAYRELHAHDAIDFSHLRAIRAVLVAAFCTYLVTYVSYALLLTQWSLLESLVVPVARAELTGLGWIAAFGLTLASVAACRLERGVLRWVPITLLVALVWNVVDPAYAWCVLAAVLASSQVWYGVAHAPFVLPFVLVYLVIDRFRGPGHHASVAYARERRRGANAVAAGNARIEALLKQWTLHPPPVQRAWSYVRLAYLPLLVAIWL